jgi:hypothetical protein
MRIILWIALTVLLVACSGDGQLEIAAENTETITHYAQFRDPQQNRVVIFVFADATNATEIKNHAESLVYEEDRLLAAYYFQKGEISVPPTRLSRSGSIMRANDLMYDDADIGPWRYAFLRPFVGEPRFTDCLIAPEDVLCRQR